uniref:Uncharacterized protein n=1 Tax=Solanum lycopersicum TaxID=4081 RepID=A0A494G9Y7_SOLLC
PARYFSHAHLYLNGTSWFTSVAPLITRLSAAFTRRVLCAAAAFGLLPRMPGAVAAGGSTPCWSTVAAGTAGCRAGCGAACGVA